MDKKYLENIVDLWRAAHQAARPHSGLLGVFKPSKQSFNGILDSEFDHGFPSGRFPESEVKIMEEKIAALPNGDSLDFRSTLIHIGQARNFMRSMAEREKFPRIPIEYPSDLELSNRARDTNLVQAFRSGVDVGWQDTISQHDGRIIHTSYSLDQKK